METLTIKELAPYLPYGLKALEITRGTFNDDPDIEKVIEISYKNVDVLWAKRYRLISCKPLLRPLSDLKKDKGSLFNEVVVNTVCYDEKEKHVVYALRDLSEGSRTATDFPYEIFIELCRLHFDVFGLIEKGLAIDLNTIKETVK